MINKDGYYKNMQYYTIILIIYMIHTLIEIYLHKLNKLTSMVDF